MLRLVFATLLVIASAPAGRPQGLGGAPGPLVPAPQNNGTLLGHVEGTTYYLSNGAFKIEIPVLPKLGGSISDTADVVTFDDTYSTHITIGAFPQDATQHWELSERGPKDYLVYFFSNFVLRDFKRAYPGLQVENNAQFMPGLLDGGLITFVLMPGGSMFADKVPIVDPDKPPPVAKRGNLLFVKKGFIYVISTELAERVLEGKAYHKTDEEENAILHDRLLDIASKIEFAQRVPVAAPPDK